MRYRTIVADPPWEMPEPCGLPYPTMTVEEISALPIRDWVALDGERQLYLWTTSHRLQDAFDVMRAWGFEYSITLAWCKPAQAIGGRFPANLEFVLFGRIPPKVDKRERRDEEIEIVGLLREALGSRKRSEIDAHFGTRNIAGHWFTPNQLAEIPPADKWPWVREWLAVEKGSYLDTRVNELNDSKGQRDGRRLYPRANSRWFTWPNPQRHSAKPEAFFDLVEEVGEGPYLEVFARRQRLGWDTWGNEALEHVELASGL